MGFFWVAIKEVERILRIGGFFCCISTHSSDSLHKNPLHCFKFRDDGMRTIAKYTNLEEY